MESSIKNVNIPQYRLGFSYSLMNYKEVKHGIF